MPSVSSSSAKRCRTLPSPDLLPDEPGGYAGYQGIFAHRYVVPALMQALGKAPHTVLNDLNGAEIDYLTVTNSGTTPVSSLQVGFPGFDGMFPAVTLSYATTMLEAGVPVVYGYFSDAHDHHHATADGVNPQGSDFAYGPGKQGYVNRFKQYDAAFATFFARLKKDGIRRERHAVRDPGRGGRQVRRRRPGAREIATASPPPAPIRRSRARRRGSRRAR